MIQDLKNRAFQVLKGNICQGETKEGKEYFYIRPALNKYPHQWAWDSCFHSIAMSHFDVEMAKKELRTLLSCVEADGFLSHLIFWQDLRWPKKAIARWSYASEKSNNLIHPPVIGLALERIYQKDNDRKFLAEVLPKAAKFYQWIGTNRVIDETFLPYLIHPWELGTDGSPQLDFIYGFKKRRFYPFFAFQFTRKFIEILLAIKKHRLDVKKIAQDKRPYLVKSCLFNSIYALGLSSIARLWQELGDEKKAKGFKRGAEKVEQSIIKYHYCPELGLFLDLFGAEDKKNAVVTISSLMPLILNNIPAGILERLIKEHLLNPQEFWVPYPLPTVPQNSPYFEIYHYWPLSRGLTAVNFNWFLVNGLLGHNFEDLAFGLFLKTKKMIERAGFWEFYHPLRGEGIGGRGYGWSTLVVDMMESFEK